ncbi:hypothetical protein ABK040_005923 [Willaertia magna]
MSGVLSKIKLFSPSKRVILSTLSQPILRTFHTSLFSLSTLKQDNQNRNDYNNTKKTSKLKLTAFLLLGIPTALFSYLYLTEGVDSIKYDPKDFILSLNNNFFVYKHYFQLNFPPIANSSNMTVVKYGNDNKKILLYNVVELTDVVKDLISKLGDNVETVVIPNKEHHLFAHAYVKYYILDKKRTNVKFFCPPGSKDSMIKSFNKKLNRNLTDTLNKVLIEFPKDYQLPREWLEDKDLNNRFKVQTFESIAVLQEIVLFDTFNKMLIACDMAHNIQQVVGDATVPGKIGMKLYGKFMGINNKFGVSPMYRLIVKDKKKLSQEVENVNNWDWKGITMAHGKPLLPKNDRDLRKEWKEDVTKNLLK